MGLNGRLFWSMYDTNRTRVIVSECMVGYQESTLIKGFQSLIIWNEMVFAKRWSREEKMLMPALLTSNFQLRRTQKRSSNASVILVEQLSVVKPRKRRVSQIRNVIVAEDYLACLRILVNTSN